MRPYLDSPQYEESRNRFEHPSGYRNDKGVFELMKMAGAFLTREKDPAEMKGFPLRDPGRDTSNDAAGSDVVRRHGVGRSCRGDILTAHGPSCWIPRPLVTEVTSHAGGGEGNGKLAIRQVCDREGVTVH